MDMHQALLGAAVEVIANDEHRQGIAADGAAEEQAQGAVFGPLDLCSVAMGWRRYCLGIYLLLIWGVWPAIRNCLTGRQAVD